MAPGELVEIKLLGRFSVTRAHSEVPPTAFAGRLARKLTRILAAHRGRMLTRDFLTEALWPTRQPADPAGNINVLVNRARRALGDSSLILTGEGGYGFATVRECVVDTELFLERADSARKHLAESQTSAAMRELSSALQLWAGDPLAEDAYDDWASEARERLFAAHREVLALAATTALSLRDFSEAARLAHQAVSADPLNEATNLILARALHSGGDAAGALKAFDDYRKRLADELGLEPSAEAEDLQLKILRGEPIGSRMSRPAIRPADFSEPLFIGRERELAALAPLIEGAGLRAAMVRGHSGAGKSRLLREVAARSTMPVVNARAYLPERDEPWGLARSLLREALALDIDAVRAVPERAAAVIADIVPELEDYRTVPHEIVDPEARGALALEGSIRLIEGASHEGLLLIADDLQWADASSVALLARAWQRIPNMRILLAYRADEMTDLGLLDTWMRARDTRIIDLGPLAEAAVRDLIADEKVADAIARASDCSPLAVTEVVRKLAADGVLHADARGRWWSNEAGAAEVARSAAAAGQRRAFLARAAAHKPTARETLSLLSLLGRAASARTLSAASGRAEPEVLDDLDALARSELVTVNDRGWTTSHDLIDATIEADLSSPERGRLHHALARALQDEGLDPAEIGRHLAEAGEADRGAAAFAEAGSRSLARFANDDAIHIAERGLALAPNERVESLLLGVRAEASARSGNLSAARTDFRRALNGAADGPRRAALLCRMAMLALGAEDVVHAAELVDLALAEAGSDPNARAAALAAGAIADMNLGMEARAEQRSGEALELFERAGNAAGVADILDGRAMATFLEGRIREGAVAFDRVARLFVDSGNLLRITTPRTTRGHALVFMGQPEIGLRDIDEALDVADGLGHEEGRSYAQWHRSEALVALGRIGEGLASAEDALRTAQRINHRGWTATALRGIGIAHQAAGRLEAAEDAFRQSLAASEHLSLFASWAASRIALVLIERGKAEEARPYVESALAEGPPLGHYEARLAHAELAAVAGAPDAPSIARAALRRAQEGGHIVSVGRLEALAG